MLLRHEHDSLFTAGELLRIDELHEGHSLLIQSCTCDPRLVLPGDLFVLLPNPTSLEREICDAKEAIARGCSIIATERPLNDLIPVDLLRDEVPVCLVSNARRTYGRVLHALGGDPSQEIDLFAVVGTTRSDKRIIAHLLAHVLAQQGGAVGLDETLSASSGDYWTPDPGCAPDSGWVDPRRPIPESAALLERLHQMTEAEWSYGVLDISHEAIASECLAGVSLKAVCLADMMTPRQALLNILDEGGLLIVDLDQPNSESLLRACPRPALTIGFHADAQISAVPLECYPTEQTFLLCAGEDMIPVRTRIDRPEHIRNCMLAAAAGLVTGMDLTAIVRGLESFETLAELEA
jgi:UDP-N-acetylmuramyl tripeptide synthase